MLEEFVLGAVVGFAVLYVVVIIVLLYDLLRTLESIEDNLGR